MIVKYSNWVILLSVALIGCDSKPKDETRDLSKGSKPLSLPTAKTLANELSKTREWAWLQISPGDWWQYQTKQEGTWIEGSTYKDSVVSIEEKGASAILHIARIQNVSIQNEIWKVDSAGNLLQQIESSDVWNFLANLSPQVGMQVPDGLAAFITSCEQLATDSCIVFQEFDPTNQDEEMLMNWTGIIQAKGIGVYSRASHEIGDYLKSYRIKGQVVHVENAQ